MTLEQVWQKATNQYGLVKSIRVKYKIQWNLLHSIPTFPAAKEALIPRVIEFATKDDGLLPEN